MDAWTKWTKWTQGGHGNAGGPVIRFIASSLHPTLGRGRKGGSGEKIPGTGGKFP